MEQRSCRRPDKPSLTSSSESSSPIQLSSHSALTSVSDLFAAYENEYTVFSPLSNCFELYGLDFMLSDDYEVFLLEVNPGPDFKQTGSRLQKVIVSLWEHTCRVILDQDQGLEQQQGKRDGERGLIKVYEKEWSVGMMQGGGGMKLV
jgi:hypothetical protein